MYNFVMSQKLWGCWPVTPTWF